MTKGIDYPATRAFWVERGKVAPEWMDYAASADRFLSRTWQADLRRLQMRFLFEETWPLVRARPRVVDLGCGPGTWAMAMAPLCSSLQGVDVSPGFVAEAARAAQAAGHRHLSFTVDSLVAYQFTGPADLVVLGAVLLYVADEDLGPLLRRIRAALAPGGVVYVRQGLAPRARRLGNRNSPAVYRTHAEYMEAFNAAGFKVAVTRDTTYTRSMLAAIYSGVAHFGTLGLTARPGPARLLRRVLEGLEPLTFGLGARVLDLSPLPICNHYILEDAAPAALPARAAP